jgi:N utilization substance protein A
MVLEVKKAGPRVKIILTRAHKDLVRCLFELEVPEIAEGIIEIRRIEREPGYRTKLAVHSSDEKVDCVGACVGVRGTRIKSIIDELNGERIDIIRWNADQEALITNALKPADIAHIQLDETSRKALVLVDEDQLSLAIGRRGQNVRLASKLTGWEIDIMTRAELEKTIAEEDAAAEASELTDEEAPAPETGPLGEGEGEAATLEIESPPSANGEEPAAGAEPAAAEPPPPEPAASDEAPGEPAPESTPTIEQPSEATEPRVKEPEN